MSLSPDAVDRGLQTLRDVLVSHLNNGHIESRDLLQRLESFTEVPLASTGPTLTDDERTKVDLQTVIERAVFDWRKNGHKIGKPMDWHVACCVLKAIQDLKIHEVRTVATASGEIVFFSSQDVAELKRLVVYTHEVYGLGGATASNWQPFEHVSGMLAQMSNILVGIHGLFQSYRVQIDGLKQRLATATADIDTAYKSRDKAVEEANQVRRAGETIRDVLQQTTDQLVNTRKHAEAVRAERDAARLAGHELGGKERALILAEAALDLAGWRKNQFGGWEPKPDHRQIPFGVCRYKIEHRKKVSPVDDFTAGWNCGFPGKPEHHVWASSEAEAVALGYDLLKFRGDNGTARDSFDVRVTVVEGSPQSAATPPKKPHTACLTCGEQSTWVRRTQDAGDHFYCVEHAREQKDFGEEDHTDKGMYWQRVADMRPPHDGVPA
jgi:hypothetical protein